MQGQAGESGRRARSAQLTGLSETRAFTVGRVENGVMGFRFLAFSESSRVAQSGGPGHERPEAILLLQDTTQLKIFTRMRVLRLVSVVTYVSPVRVTVSHTYSTHTPPAPP